MNAVVDGLLLFQEGRTMHQRRDYHKHERKNDQELN
jgi:hypothetical protein